MCKICLKRTIDATFLDCLALTFCDVIGEFIPEWACLILQGGTTFLLTSEFADIPVSRVRKHFPRRAKVWYRSVSSGRMIFLPYSQSYPYDLPRMTSLSSTGGWMISYTTCFARKITMTAIPEMTELLLS